MKFLVNHDKGEKLVTKNKEDVVIKKWFRAGETFGAEMTPEYEQKVKKGHLIVIKDNEPNLEKTLKKD